MPDAPALLREAACLIDQRAAQRDLPQERSMRRAVLAFNALSGLGLTETQGWLFMAVLKLSRAFGGRFNEDDLLDCAAYVALALECELAGPSESAQEAPGATQGSGGLHPYPFDPATLQEWLGRPTEG